MVADMIAGTYSMYRDRVQRGLIHPPEFHAKPETRGKLAFLELQPNALTELKDGFEKMRERKIAHYEAQRAARKKLSSSEGSQ
jgi:hypothetical protein